MSCASRSLIVAASVGVVEVLKDQGVCRWNYAFRSLHQQAKKSIASSSSSSSCAQARKLFPRRLDSSSPSPSAKDGQGAEKERKQAEESLRKVMYLSCWGPN